MATRTAPESIADKLAARLEQLEQRVAPDMTRRREEQARAAAIRDEARVRWDAEVGPRRDLAARYLATAAALRDALAATARLARELDAIVFEDHERAGAQRRAREIGGLDVGEAAPVPPVVPADAVDHLTYQCREAEQLAAKYHVSAR